MRWCHQSKPEVDNKTADKCTHAARESVTGNDKENIELKDY